MESELSRGEGFEGFTPGRRWVPLVGMRGTYLETRGGTARDQRTSPDSIHPLLEWVIVGGGIHGTYLSGYLTRSCGYSPAQLAVIDPHGEPLHRWRQNTFNVGMEHLRSAAVHHLDLPSLSLKRFAAGSGPGDDPSFRPPYGRPSRALFNAHADATIRAHGLEGYRRKGRVTRLVSEAGGFRIAYATGSGESRELSTRRVLLAIGMNDETCYPPWAEALRGSGGRVHHVLDPDFRRPTEPTWERAIVYGGGLSGVQLSLALARLAPGTVTLLSGHRMEVHLFDSEPSWQGANFMRSFAAERDPGRRREIIRRERHRGSLTPEAARDLEEAQRRGVLEVVEVDPRSITGERAPGAGRSLAVGTNRGIYRGDLLVLATGYDTGRPGGEWLDRAVDELGLPCAPCGFPIPTPALEWTPGLFVSGPLAELEIGPVARNISGAHRTAARLEYFLSLPSPHLASKAG